MGIKTTIGNTFCNIGRWLMKIGKVDCRYDDFEDFSVIGKIGWDTFAKGARMIGVGRRVR